MPFQGILPVVTLAIAYLLCYISSTLSINFLMCSKCFQHFVYLRMSIQIFRLRIALTLCYKFSAFHIPYLTYPLICASSILCIFCVTDPLHCFLYDIYLLLLLIKLVTIINIFFKSYAFDWLNLR